MSDTKLNSSRGGICRAGTLALFAFLTFSTGLATRGHAQTSFLIKNARVFDGENVRASTDVLVRGTRIVAIGPGLTAPSGTQTIDATGKTLLPGLIDAHTHAFGDALREALVFGVTTELDMFSDAQVARALRSQQRAGNVPERADLYSAST